MQYLSFPLRHPVETSSPLTTKSFELSVEFEDTFVEVPDTTDSACKQFPSFLIQTAGTSKIDEDAPVLAK